MVDGVEETVWKSEMLWWATTLSHIWPSRVIHSFCRVAFCPRTFWLFNHFMFSPLAFFLSFYSPPCPSFYSPLFHFHSPSTTQGMFSFQMRALKKLVTRWYVCRALQLMQLMCFSHLLISPIKQNLGHQKRCRVYIFWNECWCQVNIWHR